MAIRDFGTSLLENVRERKDSQARNARKREKKEERKDALQGLLLKGAISIGNTVLADKNEKFLQNENFYARNAKLKTNVSENNAVLNGWNSSLTYEGGQDEYYNAKALAKIQTMPVAEQFKLENPDQYSSYMHTYSSELGRMMKENAQQNFEKASANVESWSEDPEEGFKKSILKGKPRNVTEFFTLPIANLFSGNDERTADQAAINSIESEKGLASQGKVEAKELKNIYEQTNNFEFALDSAEEIKKFKDRFVSGTAELPASTPTKGEIIKVEVEGRFGTMVEKSVYQLKIGERTVGLMDVSTGKSITNSVLNASANETAQIVPSEIIEGIREVHREALISEADVKDFKNYKSQILKDDPSDKEKDAFNQNYFGKIAITRNTLNAKFSSVQGWNSTLATKFAAQIGIENLKAIKDSGAWLIGSDSYKTNSSLLTGSDQYSSVLALKALLALENRGSITTQGAIATLKQEIADNLDLDQYMKSLTVVQENVVYDITKNDKSFSALFIAPIIETPDPEEILLTEANATAGAVVATDDITELLAKMPIPKTASDGKFKPPVIGDSPAPYVERKQKSDYAKVLRAFKLRQEALDNPYTNALGSRRIKQQQARTIANAMPVYNEYMKNYGESN